jgi:hypothetical protein
MDYTASIMTIPKHYSKKMILISVALVVCLVAGAYVYYVSSWRINDMPGKVIGNNSKHIPESKLPQCTAPAGGIDNEPCYSPPGAVYF